MNFALLISTIAAFEFPELDKTPKRVTLMNTPIEIPSSINSIVHSQCLSPQNWAIAFHNGPSAFTTEILSLLSQHSIKATFFLSGSQILRFPNQVVQIFKQGHQIGITSWSGLSFADMDKDQILSELLWTITALMKIIGFHPQLVYDQSQANQALFDTTSFLQMQVIHESRSSKMFTSIINDFNFHSGESFVFRESIRTLSILEQGLLDLKTSVIKLKLMSTCFKLEQVGKLNCNVDAPVGYIKKGIVHNNYQSLEVINDDEDQVFDEQSEDETDEYFTSLKRARIDNIQDTSETTIQEELKPTLKRSMSVDELTEASSFKKRKRLGSQDLTLKRKLDETR